jgi:murein DD-endopeptidase MepM/ murein hydrolase activator NlpD
MGMWPVRPRRRAEAAVALLLLAGAPASAAPGAIGVAVAARSIQPGELTVFTLSTTEPVDGVRLRAFNREIAAFKEGALTWRALVGVDLDAAPRIYHVTVEAKSGGQSIHTTYDLRVEPRHFPTRTLTVDEAFVNPPAGVRDRIVKEARELETLWTRSAPGRLWTGPFALPVSGRAVSSFGTRSIFNGQPRSPHSGADFLSPAGTPIEAPNAGHVVLARNLYFLGNTVVIDHGLGLFSMLAHLSALEVHEGDEVTPGRIVGRVGATGRVTGPHLHWAVRAGGARIDPLSLVALLGRP